LKKYRSTTNSKFALLFLAFALVLILPSVTPAQDADQQDADPPSRVARLNFIQGSVSFQPAGTSDWLDANPNRPLTTGDQLWADQDSRGELNLGGSVLRISGQTAVSFLNLNDQAVQIQVAQGSADLRVLHLEDNENYEIDTPNAAFSILRPGEYRVDVSQDGTSSVVSVDTGDGEATAGGQAYNVARGQQYIFSGTDEISYDAEALPEPDDFQRWNLERDQREDHFASAQYVSRDVIGYEDLDDHGTWREDPTYGHIWFPNGVAVGWAPYHYGHWAFVGPWGWTWVEDEPWGFAPFHYGRWAMVGGGWGWVPGPMPVYAPALVAFIGGGGFAASIEIGGAAGVGVAWFPLGPRDVWVPSYHVSAVYMTNVNITNTRVVNRTEITNVYNTTVINRTTNVTVNRSYQYQSSPGAVTAVSKSTFQNGEPVSKAAVQVNAQEIEHARVVQTAAIAPTPRAIAGPNTPAKPSSRPPATLASRPVVTKMAPSARAIPVGQTKPAPRTAYRSMANAKPATSQPPARTGAQPANRLAEPSAAGAPAAQPRSPIAAPAERSAPATRTEPPTRTNEAPPANRAEPPARTNEPPARETQPPARPNEAQPNRPAAPPVHTQPPRENQSPVRTNEAPANKPAPPPNRTPPPAHENAPPAHTNAAPAEKPAPNKPPAHENPPKQTPPAEAKPAPHPPAPETKKPNPPAKEKESKPPKEPKDKEKPPQS
jgi:hypothetical protein